MPQDEEIFVTTIQDFKRKYGTKGWQLVIEEIIRRAPAYPNDTQLAAELGRIVADLESILVRLP
jgi:hypothetical protein